jgi:hypothetical protein
MSVISAVSTKKGNMSGIVILRKMFQCQPGMGGTFLLNGNLMNERVCIHQIEGG